MSNLSPLSAEEQDRYVFHCRRFVKPGGMGGHVTRRKGQSLTFREFDRYTPGEDIRHVDWRASLRYRGQGDLLMRRFMAEERLTVLVSVDTRVSMTYPASMPKIQQALWLLATLSQITTRMSDQVYIHRLFGRESEALIKSNGRKGWTSAQFSRISETGAEDEINLDHLGVALPPTGIWVIVTDLYFQSQMGQLLADRIRRAREGPRWIILVDLDSWPLERAQMGVGPRLLEGPQTETHRVQMDEQAWQLVARRIQSHKQAFLERIDLPSADLTTWSWPRLPTGAESFFRDQFRENQTLQRLFMRDAL